MSSTQSQNLAAVLPAAKARLILETRPIPSPKSGELVIRNHAIAANPVDWKIQDYSLFVEKYPTVLGSDVCGVVVAVGPNATGKFKEGDRVCGFAAVIYNSNIDHGAWQTYTVLREIATTKIPDSMGFVEGSMFPMAFATAAVALFVTLEIPYLPVPTKGGAKKDETLLIWGAGSSVGSAAVQIAKAYGYTVFATASKSNHEWIEKLGADQLFDYRDHDVVEQIVTAASKEGKPIRIAFDPISEGSTLDMVPEVVRKSLAEFKASDGAGKVGSGPGKVSTVLWWPEGKPQPPADEVEIVLTVAMRTGTDKSDLGAWLFNDWLKKALSDGTVVPAPPIEVVEGGLETTQEVFDRLKAGVSGKKLVMKV